MIPRSGRSPRGGNPSAFLPGESHGQRSLVGYSPLGHIELDMTEQLSKHKELSMELTQQDKYFFCKFSFTSFFKPGVDAEFYQTPDYFILMSICLIFCVLLIWIVTLKDLMLHYLGIIEENSTSLRHIFKIIWFLVTIFKFGFWHIFLKCV